MNKLYVISLLALLVSCKTQFGLVHTVQSPDGSSVVVQNLGDIIVTVEPFTTDTWSRIAKSSQFIDRSKTGRLPKIPFFLILIENKSTQPLRVKEIAIIYSGMRLPVLTKDELKNYLSSPAYEFIKSEELCTPLRLLTYSGKIQNINFALDVVPFTLPFIPPKDIHCAIVAGKWIPVNEQKFTVEIVLQFPDNEKIVDCTFIRQEYRTKGTHFIKPKLEEH